MGSPERLRRRRYGEQGNVLAFVSFFMVILMGFGALGVDLASYYVARTETQRGVDSAALAGAKMFVESGCVTNGDCTTEQTFASNRASQVAEQNLVEGQPLPAPAITFINIASQNPQITVRAQSAPLNLYFINGFIGLFSGGRPSKITVASTATAEAYNPSGTASGRGPIFCTGCVRPWLIPNTAGYLLNPASNYSVTSPGCVTNGGVIGEPIQIAIETKPALYGAVDDGTETVGYQQSITSCNTGQLTCGTIVNTLPGNKQAFTTPSVDKLLHLPGGTTGAPPPAAFVSAGQDTIVTSACPPQIQAGALNPLVFQGVISAGAVVATSDSIVTAYIYDPSTPLSTTESQAVTIVGFAQIFVTQVDTNGDVEGDILGVAGCGTNAGGTCGSVIVPNIQGPTMLPVRLITKAPSDDE